LFLRLTFSQPFLDLVHGSRELFIGMVVPGVYHFNSLLLFLARRWILVWLRPLLESASVHCCVLLCLLRVFLLSLSFLLGS
jgi:hypothetical protein